jgi:gamma-glutamylcyclotransferase (GGCT)/AIG2-like uncharacterized protein YtfP
MYLFVYGTLKRGQPRHRFLAGQTFVAAAVTRPLYRMFNAGEYPALVRHADGRPVEGELWEVSEACVTTIDAVEGCDVGLYVRAPVKLLPPHDCLAVETYLYGMTVDGFADYGSRWPS